jgi:hypothetical protein
MGQARATKEILKQLGIQFNHRKSNDQIPGSAHLASFDVSGYGNHMKPATATTQLE